MKNKVMKFFQANPNSFYKAIQIAGRLKINDDDEYAELKKTLHSLYVENFLEKEGKKFRHTNEPIEKYIKGILEITPQGYGFVVRANASKQDIFIAERNLGCAFHGDSVEVELFAKIKKKNENKNLEGHIVNVVKRKFNELSGTLHKANSFYYVTPDLNVIHRNIYVSEKNLGAAKEGDKLIIGEIFWQNPNVNPEGKVLQHLGLAFNLDSEALAIATEFKLPYKFSSKCIEEAESISDVIPDSEISLREDFRNKNVFTIDPEDAKDFDDALSIETLENGNYEIGIHIADVSHYVTKGSGLDKESLERGNSVYLVGRVIPMLPEKLSNEICSLVPFTDKLTSSVVAELTPRGRLVNYRIVKTVINSKRRFTYQEAQDVIETGEGDLKDDILTLNKLAITLKAKRVREGSINFSTTEVKFLLNEEGLPIGTILKQAKESNNLIEEFMLLANKIVAIHVATGKIRKQIYPFLYRIHDKPNKEKLSEFVRFVKSLNYPISLPAIPTAKDFNMLTDFIKGKPEEMLINDLAVRSMAKAVYSADNIGHFGLGFQFYTHFTSPIRRYSDLIVHRLIFEYLAPDYKGTPSKGWLDSVCEHISLTERSAVDAERFSVKQKQIQFLKSRIGDVFDAIITGVTNFGMFVRITKSYAEGLIHIRDLGKDFYVYDEKKYSLIGKASKKVYRIGDKLKVQLIRIDQDRSSLDFIINETNS